MSYTKTTWVDHIKSSNAFNISQNSDETYNITPAGSVIQQGTPMSAENFNHMEEGIYSVSKQCDELAEKTASHYTQSTAAKVWVITHNMGRPPSVTIIDDEGDMVLCDIEYTDDNTVTLRFSEATAGTVYFN